MSKDLKAWPYFGEAAQLSQSLLRLTSHTENGTFRMSHADDTGAIDGLVVVTSDPELARWLREYLDLWTAPGE